jgi:hypothetical protein
MIGIRTSRLLHETVDTNCVTAVELEELVAKTSEASAHFEMNSQLSFQSTLEWILGL